MRLIKEKGGNIFYLSQALSHFGINNKVRGSMLLECCRYLDFFSVYRAVITIFLFLQVVGLLHWENTFKKSRLIFTSQTPKFSLTYYQCIVKCLSLGITLKVQYYASGIICGQVDLMLDISFVIIPTIGLKFGKGVYRTKR